MTTIRRTAVATIALSAVLGLSACNNETAATSPSSGGSTNSTDSGSAGQRGATTGGSESTPDAPATSDDAGEGGSTSSDSATDDGAEAQDTPKAPATTGSVKDSNAIPVERAGLPDGPVTDLDVKLLGGYAISNDYGQFYAVLDVTSTEPGLIKLQYVMLDKSGKPLKTVDDSINVAGTSHELKVTRAGGSLPTAENGKVAKVRLKVVENDANSFATVTQIKPNSLKIGHDSSTNTPIVSGQYRTKGKASVISMNAVCADDKGVVRAANSPVDKIKAPNWTPFTVKFLSAKQDFKPTSCFVGS